VRKSKVIVEIYPDRSWSLSTLEEKGLVPEEIKVEGIVKPNGEIKFKPTPEITYALLDGVGSGVSDAVSPENMYVKLEDDAINTELNLKIGKHLYTHYPYEESWKRISIDIFNRLTKRDIYKALKTYEKESFINQFFATHSPFLYADKKELFKEHPALKDMEENMRRDIKKRLKRSSAFNEYIEIATTKLYENYIKPIKEECQKIEDPDEYDMCVKNTLDKLPKPFSLISDSLVTLSYLLDIKDEELPQELKEELCDIYLTHKPILEVEMAISPPDRNLEELKDGYDYLINKYCGGRDNEV